MRDGRAKLTEDDIAEIVAKIRRRRHIRDEITHLHHLERLLRVEMRKLVSVEIAADFDVDRRTIQRLIKREFI